MRFKREDVLKRTLRSSYLGRQHCLMAHIHADKLIRVGQQGGNRIQPGQVTVGLRQQRSQRYIEMNVWIWGRWNECAVAGELLNVTASTVGIK